MHTDLHFNNNKRAYRFEAQMPDGEYMTLTYRWLKSKMLLMQTTVPASARDTGAADRLIQHALEHARSHGLKIVVYCPMVTEYMRQNRQYDELLAS